MFDDVYGGINSRLGALERSCGKLVGYKQNTLAAQVRYNGKQSLRKKMTFCVRIKESYLHNSEFLKVDINKRWRFAMFINNGICCCLNKLLCLNWSCKLVCGVPL